MIKVLILSYYFPPAGGSGVQRWMFFSRYLPENGIEPIVITVDVDKASYRFIDYSLEKNVSGIKIIRTKTREILSLYSFLRGGDKRSNIPQGFAGEPNPSFLQKISRFIRGNIFLPDARRGWNRFAYQQSVKTIKSENIGIVITTGPPHSTHLVGRKLKKKYGIKWIADFRDPWTEVYYNRALYKSRLANKIDSAMERRVLNEANTVVTIGPGMQKMLQGKLPEPQRSKVHYVYNGFDGELFDRLVKIPADYFCISHLGILSENQPIDAFLEGLRLCLDRNIGMKRNFRLQFVGDISPSIIKKAEEKIGRENLELVGYVQHAEAVQYMKNADLLLNSFAISDDSSLLVSGKLMEYIATGNPIIGLGHPEGDAALLMKRNPHMSVFDRENILGITLFIEMIYLHWLNKDVQYSTDESYKKYSRQNMTRELSQIIRTLI